MRLNTGVTAACAALLLAGTLPASAATPTETIRNAVQSQAFGYFVTHPSAGSTQFAVSMGGRAMFKFEVRQRADAKSALCTLQVRSDEGHMISFNDPGCLNRPNSRVIGPNGKPAPLSAADRRLYARRISQLSDFIAPFARYRKAPSPRSGSSTIAHNAAALVQILYDINRTTASTVEANVDMFELKWGTGNVELAITSDSGKGPDHCMVSQQGKDPRDNLVLVDNGCDGGADLYKHSQPAAAADHTQGSEHKAPAVGSSLSNVMLNDTNHTHGYKREDPLAGAGSYDAMLLEIDRFVKAADKAFPKTLHQ